MQTKHKSRTTRTFTISLLLVRTTTCSVQVTFSNQKLFRAFFALSELSDINFSCCRFNGRFLGGVGSNISFDLEPNVVLTLLWNESIFNFLSNVVFVVVQVRLQLFVFFGKLYCSRSYLMNKVFKLLISFLFELEAGKVSSKLAFVPALRESTWKHILQLVKIYGASYS